MTDTLSYRLAALTGRSDPTPDILAAIQSLQSQGLGITEIARIYGLHPQQISRVLKDNGNFSPAVVKAFTGKQYASVRVVFLVPDGYDLSAVPSYIMGFAPRQCARTGAWFLPIVPWQKYAPENESVYLFEDNNNDSD